MWADIEALRRRMADAGYPDALLIVPEVHPKGHGWHVHAAVAEFVPKEILERCWGLGFVDIRKIRLRNVASNLTSGARAQARACAGYIAGYVSKLSDVPTKEEAEELEGNGVSRDPVATRPFNGKRYSTPRGTSDVEVVRCTVPSRWAAFLELERLGFDWDVVWRSPSPRDSRWRGPPTMLVFG
jgi:hypothetical protein